MTEPPGGPPDSTPPHIVTVHPESGSVVPKLDDDAVLHFDEVIDEMSGKGGGTAKGVASSVILSPVAGPVKVAWHRSSISVKPAEGWKKGRVYHLQLLPGLADLRHNVMKQGAMIVFSTGPAVPRASLSGTALQWVDQRVLAQAAIRAALLPDTVAYVTLADSAGAFTFSNIPRGRYRVYAIQDQNGDRRIDPREAFDSTVVTVDTTANLVLWAFQHDTTGPKLQAADPSDSITVRLTFSQPLEPRRGLDTLAVRVVSLPDSTPVRVRAVLTGALQDSILARERAVADSLRRAKDTTRAQPSPARPSRQPTAAPSKRDTTVAHVDTARIRELLRARPVPTDRWVLKTARPLKPGGKYLVRIRGALNLTGASANPQTVFVVPIPKPPPAAPAAKDTVHNKPAKPTR
ncbi:MAG TPA: Ig-like domain-containing protein [Gemmatimonadales bacterium]|nr:Ig-like domain-containing protein [Gemmatimonadales bacterium]